MAGLQKRSSCYCKEHTRPLFADILMAKTPCTKPGSPVRSPIKPYCKPPFSKVWGMACPGIEDPIRARARNIASGASSSEAGVNSIRLRLLCWESACSSSLSSSRARLRLHLVVSMGFVGPSLWSRGGGLCMLKGHCTVEAITLEHPCPRSVPSFFASTCISSKAKDLSALASNRHGMI